jgi:protein-S-isoprenylcysteine O-methyltransferase Ste14
MYGSLLLLAWGVFLKRVSTASIVTVAVTTVMVVVASEVEEKENVDVFGADYKAYIPRSKRFLPYLW